jgi:hypothetical protein
MKKIRAIVLALLCLTIGGVYATWTFADDTSVDRKGQTVTITLAGKAETSEVLGSLAVTLSKDFEMTIDQKEVGDHTAVLKIAPGSSIELKFTPNDNAAIDIRNNGIKAHFYFAVSSSLQYNDANSDSAGLRPVFAVNTNTKYIIDRADETSVAGENEVIFGKWVKPENSDSFVCTIDAATLGSYITLNNFKIDNSEEYAAFNEVLRSGTITLYLNDAATPLA